MQKAYENLQELSHLKAFELKIVQKSISDGKF